MDFIEKWYKDLTTRTSGIQIRKDIEAWGEHCHKAPAIRYAKVKIRLSPSETLQVVDELDEDKSETLRHNSWFEQIVFGVLDVMMTSLPTPHRYFKLTILDVDIDEIASVPIAFRLAARDAAQKILRKQLDLRYFPKKADAD